MKNNLAAACCTLVSVALFLLVLRFVADFWLLGIVYSLQLHIAVLAALGALLAVILGARRFGSLLLVAALAVALFTLHLENRIQPKQHALAAGTQTLKLVSFNILGNNRANGGRIADMIVSSGADLVYIFESAPLRPYVDTLAKAYPYRVGCGAVVAFCDVMILSKRPLSDPRMLALSDLRQERLATADIDVGGVTVHLGAAHVSKPYFDAYHTQELEALSAFMHPRPGPWIIAGDFNAAAIAPDMQAFVRRDAMTTTGWEPATWPTWAGPFGVPIDHVFVSKSLSARSIARIPEAYGSNHYGLTAEIAVPPAGPQSISR
ncbi:endonuclease/exonuclease/phosphatase family protein [Rhizobium halophytocola]|uniref:Endonuclease/exonuclease/phosphatase (EEP) superfamily protein YafD n=1 Tax=Rhizobium halophytocola TaxID=735519 RepID=A0ABS4E3R2_9HYPH|nr:endonuclease/exonuclease/phosphatase family protein [Rhizobium halophytocola]MBP1852585.1 endonuclease/exonuclease/phosphatase (EEP) superfamily protein YafD [Rhizobium halophytocola]